MDEISKSSGRPRRRGAAWIALLATAAIGLAACNALTNSNEGPRPPDAFERVRGIDLTPRFPQPAESGSAIGERTPRAATYPGNASDGVRVIEGAQLAPAGDGYELNFENTPVTTVAKVILGDILGLGYTIDPRVQGTVSISSGRPVPKADILYVLESTLRMSNVGLARDAGGYRLIPLAEAAGSGSVDVARPGGRPEPGYGVTVLPLYYVSAGTLIKLLDSFALRPGMVRSEPTRNSARHPGHRRRAPQRRGDGAQLRRGLDAGQSVGIYPVRNSNPETVIAELEKIMETGEGGLGQNVVKFQPIQRLNAVLVVSRKTEFLRTAATWISRLDQADTVSTGVRVYRVRYGDARQIASVLNEVFIGRSSAGTFDSASNQIAPGSGLTSLSSSSGGGLGGGTTPQPGIWSSSGSALGGGSQVPPGSTGMAGGGTFGGAAPARGTGIGGFGAGGGGLGGAAGSQAVLANVRISADVANNSLLIYASHENYRIIERTLREVDRPQLQVSIDATIAEITLNDSLRYGVQYFLRSQDIGLQPNKGSIGFNIGTSQPLSRVLPGFNFLLGSENDPQLVLDAIRTVSTVKVLSAPSVVVVDNQVATLLVGDQIPIATRTATLVESPNLPVVNNIDYRNTGVILRVQPRINHNGNVLLDIEQEISNVAAAAGTGATLTPTVSQRKVKTSIAVASGQTVLLGGLISERVEQARDTLPIPGLDKIKILNDLLSHNTGGVTRTELIMFIRPQIIRDGTDAYLIAEQLRTKLTGSLGNSLVRALPNGSPAPR